MESPTGFSQKTCLPAPATASICWAWGVARITKAMEPSPRTRAKSVENATPNFCACARCSSRLPTAYIMRTTLEPLICRRMCWPHHPSPTIAAFLGEFAPPNSPPKLHHVEPAIVVGTVDYARRVHKDIRRLDDFRSAQTAIDQLGRCRGDQGPDFARRVAIADVEDPNTRVLVRGEDELRADETAWPVLMQIVRTEMPRLRLIIRIRR